MVDQKIRDLPAASSLADTDLIEVTIDPAGSPASQKATILQLKNAALPTGTNGGVLRYAGGSWASTPMGTAREVLTSGGSGSPTWSADVAPLTQRALVASGLTVETCATIVRDIPVGAGVGGAGIGGRALWRCKNGGGIIVDTAAIDGVLTDATAGAEVGALDLYAQSGGALVRVARLSGSGSTIGITAAITQYQGGARVPERTVSTTTTLDAQDEVVFVSTTGGAVTLTLPAGASGRVIAIQRVAGTSDVIVQRAASPDTIRAASTGGLTSWTISDDARHGLIFRSANTEWVAEA